VKPNDPSVAFDAQTACNIASALRSANRLDDAEAVYERVVAVFPNHAECWFQLGSIAEAKYDLERACQCYLKAVSLALEHHLYQQRAFAACVELGWRQAFFHFRIDAPLETNGLSTRGRCWQSIKQQYAASGVSIEEELRFAMRGPSDDLLKQTLAIVGRMINRENRFTEAEHACAALLEVVPELADAWYQLGLIALANGDSTTAGVRFRRARLLAGESPEGTAMATETSIHRAA
jgi:tetratricopeptide (TPR) repeat protein